MKQEINPKDTIRAQAFELWMKSSMPMVTLTKTIDVTRLCRVSHRRGIKFNMLLCWCIGKTASRIDEFYLLPEQGKLSCDILYTNDLEQFGQNYMVLTQSASTSCQSSFVDDAMVIGTSAMTATELDSIVNQYTDQFCNPMVMWGRYRKGWLRTTLPISFQFHHVQMDGGHAARFLEELQKTINTI